jgi:hypothetical protein
MLHLVQPRFLTGYRSVGQYLCIGVRSSAPYPTAINSKRETKHPAEVVPVQYVKVPEGNAFRR